MAEKSKIRKRLLITEREASNLLDRYSPMTVLTLLQEVYQVQDVKIDWNALVKNSSTGISNPREYQMVWRHLAYRHALFHKQDNATESLNDDSDLECDLEASPAISCETSAEAAACVKVLIASTDSGVPNVTIEAPLMINVPRAQLNGNVSENSQYACSMQNKSITIPVFVQKQPLPSGTPPAEPLDTNGSANTSRRKRKPWTEEEDLELIEAVRKCGEGNWASILKGVFKSDRTASQLSQRWAIIKKRPGNLNIKVPNSNGSQLSEAQLAARRAMSMALDIQPKRNLTTGGMNPNISSSRNISSSVHPTNFASTSHTIGSTSQPSTSRALNLSLLAQPRGAVKKTSPKKSVYTSDSMVKAAAVAAGARIVTKDDAASLIKSANAVYMMGPGGGSLVKGSTSVAHASMKNVRGSFNQLNCNSAKPVASQANGTVIDLAVRPKNEVVDENLKCSELEVSNEIVSKALPKDQRSYEVNEDLKI